MVLLYGIYIDERTVEKLTAAYFCALSAIFGSYETSMSSARKCFSHVIHLSHYGVVMAMISCHCHDNNYTS